jgi:organic radical activating enzyme
MNYSITVGSLVLEITRRCNMRCEHCMRGDAQALDMNLEVIDKLFESGIEFSDVTFTGGDPSLYPAAIEHFVTALQFYGRTISRFYVKTNGKKESVEMATALLKLYALCDEPDMCTLDVSRDQFHEGFDQPLLYQGLSFYHRGSDSPMEQDYTDSQIIQEGLAYENGYGKAYPRPSQFVFDEYDEGSFYVEQLQVAANGNICGQCDISFEREDEETYGNILERDINEIISAAYEAEQLEEAA